MSSAVSQERGTLVTVCCAINALGNHIPPFFAFPRVNVQENWLLTAPPGSALTGHPKASGWMTEECFTKYMQHFVKYTKPSPEHPILLLLDNHSSHISLDVINFAKEKNITMMSFPPHCSHKMQPLDVSVFSPFTTYANQTINNWMRQKENAGKSMTIHVIPKIVAYAFPKAMTPGNIMSGFKAMGIFPFDKNIFSSDQFMSAYSTDKVLENAVVETNQPLEQSTPSFSEREMTIASTSSAEQVRPFGKRPARKENATKRRKGRSRGFTDTPVRQAIKEEYAKKKTNSKARKISCFLVHKNQIQTIQRKKSRTQQANT